MTTRPIPVRLSPVAKTTLTPDPRQGAGNAALAGRQGEVHWGQANGCVFRFDPQAAPRRSGAQVAQPATRRALPLPAKRAATARAARRSSGGRGAAVSLADEAGFDYDYDYDEDDEGDAAISGAGPAQGGRSQSQGGQDEQGDHDRNSRNDGNEGHGQRGNASDNTSFATAPPAGQAASTTGHDRSAWPMLLALASADASRSLRQRALAAIDTASPTLRAAEALGQVRAALIEAVACGALVPRVDAKSPDQNCLLPLLLLRATRPMPHALRAQAGARAAAMLSMAQRIPGARKRVADPVAAP